MARQYNNHIIHSTVLATQSGAKSPSPPLTATARVYGGPGVGLAEIQACIEPPTNAKGKILAVGISRGEIEQILATVLIPTLMGAPDYLISAKLVSADRYIPSFGLALAVAMIGSYLKKPITEEYVFTGEIDLHKKVRGSNHRIIENLRRSIDCGEVDPAMSLVLPANLRASPLQAFGVKLVPCANLIEVITAVWQVDPR